jgi:hypothetical protein
MGPRQESFGNRQPSSRRVLTVTPGSKSLEYLNSIDQTQFPFLERMELSRKIVSGACSGFQLTVVLAPAQSDKAGTRLRLTFKGVTDLRIGELEGLLSLHLEARSIRDDQLEGLRYRVVESEYDIFSFYCFDFEVSLHED